MKAKSPLLINKWILSVCVLMVIVVAAAFAEQMPPLQRAWLGNDGYHDAGWFMGNAPTGDYYFQPVVNVGGTLYIVIFTDTGTNQDIYTYSFQTTINGCSAGTPMVHLLSGHHYKMHVDAIAGGGQHLDDVYASVTIFYTCTHQ
jgi:hypothetical protein